jgi:MoxR-like ATPase
VKPNDIFAIMDLAKRAREQSRTFNPCFVSPPGLGKSEIVQQWTRQQNYGFVDLRAALLESPDLTGFPTIINVNGKQKTQHATPDIFPEDGHGVLFLDEVNRGTQSVMNCFMQLLTDRKIKDYKLPEGWIIVAAINPENEQHDVNSMDAALKDRLEFFEIEYNKKVHIEYMEKVGYEATVKMFIESGAWQYVRPEEVSTTAGAKYLSPRTFSKLDTAIKAGIPEDLELVVYDSILGALTGKAFYQFKNNDQPVTFEEIEKNLKKSMKRLASFCTPENYKTGHVSITARSLLENEKNVTDEILYEVCLAIGPEQAVGLIREIEFKRNSADVLGVLTTKYPDLLKYFKAVLKK